MTTYVRAPEAARRLGVTTATLYSYVSRGRVRRTLGSDGRSSLFDLSDIEQLVAASSRPTRPPPTIDVRISTRVTQLDEVELRYRGVAVSSLVDRPFEQVCDLLWFDSVDAGVTGPALRDVPSAGAEPPLIDVLSVIRAAAEIDVTASPTEAATRLLAIVAGPTSGVASKRHSYAQRLTRNWVEDPSPELVQAVNATLVLLADHGLATSTLAVRVATSVRAAPNASLIAGLATVQGELHGAASTHAHWLFAQVEAGGAEQVLTDYRHRRERVPGFGHKIYRDCDPRFRLLLERVRHLPDPNGRLRVVEDTIDTAGGLVGRVANVDLALGALTYVSGLPADMPFFAVARIAGWTAHHLEELGEHPVRFRGLAR